MNHKKTPKKIDPLKTKKDLLQGLQLFNIESQTLIHLPLQHTHLLLQTAY